MSFAIALAFALPLGVGIAAMGCGIGLGMAVRGGLEAIGRQPEASGKIQVAMIIGFGFIEALTIYAFVTMFFLQGKIQ